MRDMTERPKSLPCNEEYQRTYKINRTLIKADNVL